MAKFNQYIIRLNSYINEKLRIRYNLYAKPINDIMGTVGYLEDSLLKTYGLSRRDFENIYRIGIGRKLSLEDSNIFEEIEIDEIVIDENLGIICPTGIISFYEDIFCPKGGEVALLASSYHFQTSGRAMGKPLYLRFEFDPLIMPNRDYNKKPIFHYHFSNYDYFEHHHFPAGHFQVENHYALNKPASDYFAPNNAVNLESFLQTLKDMKLI
jgi:hypothetical protein